MRPLEVIILPIQILQMIFISVNSLANITHPNITDDLYLSQLFGKEDIHSKDKMTIMGTDYAKLSLKTQSILRSVVPNLPTDIQLCILESKDMSQLK